MKLTRRSIFLAIPATIAALFGARKARAYRWDEPARRLTGRGRIYDYRAYGGMEIDKIWIDELETIPVSAGQELYRRFRHQIDNPQHPRVLMSGQGPSIWKRP